MSTEPKAIRRLAGLVEHEWAAWLVLVVSLGITALGWSVSDAAMHQRMEDRFRLEVVQARKAIVKRMLDYEHVLHGGEGLFDAYETVSREAWRRYVSALRIEPRFPGLEGIGFALMITPAQLRAHEAAVRAEGIPDYAVHPSGGRDRYSSVLYLEPFRDGNLRAFGSDMFAEPVRHAAMERARDTGETSISARVDMAQGLGAQPQPGLLIFVPVYLPGMPTETVAQRREALWGFVFARLHLRELMRGIRDTLAPGVEFDLYDGGETTPQALLYDSDGRMTPQPVPHRHSHEVRETIELPGRMWTAVFSSHESFEAATTTREPLIFAAGGSAMSVLLFFVVRSLARQRQRILAAANAMTVELRASEEKYRELVENANSILVKLNRAGEVVFINEYAQRFFGYGESEILGRHCVGTIVPATEHGGRDLAGLIEEILAHPEGHQHSVNENLRRDGSRAWVAWNNQVIRGPDGQVAGLFCVGSDITERKRMEDRLQHMNEELEQRVAERTAELTDALRELESFSHSASHDLRTPLRGIEGYAAVLQADYGQSIDAQGREYLQRIRHGTQRMAQLIDDMLDLALLSRRELKPEPVDLSAMAARVVVALRGREPDRQVDVRIQPGLRAQADPVLVRAALSSLIGNAWKFTRPSAAPRIEFGCEAGSQPPVFFVRDNGVGFDMTYAGKLFQPFQRLVGPAEFEGSGIGLATVARVVARHRGKVWAEAQPGRGAVFRFTLE